jgi:hypothetical protein
LSISKSIYPELLLLNNLIFKPCNLELTEVLTELESEAYFAHTFKLNQKNILFRTAKITPTKTGLFVTVWKRNNTGMIEPFNILDPVDFTIISARRNNHFGIFIFPKTVLYKHKILSSNDQKGKLGTRVYPTWELANNNQALKTQAWQTNYFIDLSNQKEINLEKAKYLLNSN